MKIPLGWSFTGLVGLWKERLMCGLRVKLIIKIILSVKHAAASTAGAMQLAIAAQSRSPPSRMTGIANWQAKRRWMQAGSIR